MNQVQLILVVVGGITVPIFAVAVQLAILNSNLQKFLKQHKSVDA